MAKAKILSVAILGFGSFFIGLSVAQEIDEAVVNSQEIAAKPDTEVQALVQYLRNHESVRVHANKEEPAALSTGLDFQALDAKTEVQLQKSVGDTFRFDEVPFSDVMSQVRTQLGVNIVLDQSALDGDLSLDQPITFDVQDVSCETALALLLNHHDCDFIVDHGIVRIISNDVAGDPEYFMIRVYDCTKLIAAAEELRQNVPLYTAQLRAADSDAGKRTIFPEPPTASRLVKVVTDSVTPGDWFYYSGDAVINQVGDMLVICHSGQGHRQVRDLLVRLESRLLPRE